MEILVIFEFKFTVFLAPFQTTNSSVIKAMLSNQLFLNCYYLLLILLISLYQILKSQRMGNNINIEQKQIKNLEQGNYFIKPNQATYLCHDNSITDEASANCLFYIQKGKSGTKGQICYYLKQTKEQFWKSPQYEWDTHDELWRMAREIQWHFFQIESNRFIIATQKIKQNFISSEYQALILVEGQRKEKKLVLRKVERNKEKCKNQLWILKKVQNLNMFKLQENTSEVTSDLSQNQSFQFSKLMNNGHETYEDFNNSNLKEKEKTCQLTISIDK